MLVSKAISHMDHDLMNIAHDFTNGPAKDIKGKKAMLFGLMLFDLFDIHFIFLNNGITIPRSSG